MFKCVPPKGVALEVLHDCRLSLALADGVAGVSASLRCEERIMTIGVTFPPPS